MLEKGADSDGHAQVTGSRPALGGFARGLTGFARGLAPALRLPDDRVPSS